MVWDAIIAIYLFLAGLGAGAFVLGALTNWAKTPAPAMKKIAFIVAPVAVAVGTLMLVVDAHAGLMNPLRFFGLVANLGSVMAWGVIILSAFLVVSIVDLIVLLVKKSTPKALDVVGAVLAVCVAAYTGVLLGDAGVAFPLWNMAVLPILFIVSAASTGIAATLLITRLVAADEAAALPWLGKAGLVLPVLELALVIVLLAVAGMAGGSAGAAGAASVANLVSGPYAVAFWLGFIVIGLAVPFVLEFIEPPRLPEQGAAHGGRGLRPGGRLHAALPGHHGRRGGCRGVAIPDGRVLPLRRPPSSRDRIERSSVDAEFGGRPSSLPVMLAPAVSAAGVERARRPVPLARFLPFPPARKRDGFFRILTCIENDRLRMPGAPAAQRRTIMTDFAEKAAEARGFSVVFDACAEAFLERA